MSRIFVINEGVRVIFYSNYKVMSSILHKMLRESFPRLQTSMNLNKITHHNRYKKIAIVRNPYDRFLSLFFDKCRFDPNRKKNSEASIFLQKNQAHIIRAYNTLHGKCFEIVEPEQLISPKDSQYKLLLMNLKILESLSLIDFLNIVKYIRSQSYIDPHFLMQSDIMTYDDQLILDKYFKLEDIKSQWENICLLIGRNITLRWGKNRTNYEGINKFQRYYSDTFMQELYNLYENDLLNFKYDKLFYE